MLTGQYFNYYRSTCILFPSNFVWVEKAVEDGWLYAKTCLVKRQGRFLEFSFVLEGKNGRIITRKKKKNLKHIFNWSSPQENREKKIYDKKKQMVKFIFLIFWFATQTFNRGLLQTEISSKYTLPLNFSRNMFFFASLLTVSGSVYCFSARDSNFSLIQFYIRAGLIRVSLFS